MTLSSRALAALLALAFAGCGQRVLVAPSVEAYSKGSYLYLVENAEGKDSVIKRCEIHQDNHVTCSVQYDLD